MKSIGLFEAKTHLSALIKCVIKGETIQITNHGLPVAKLVPIAETVKLNARKAAERIRELRKGVRLELGGMSMREFAHLGHKY